MTIYKWPYKNDHVRQWLTISLGWECSNSRNPRPVGGAGLGGGGGGEGVHRVLLRLSVISLRWRGGSLLRYPWSSLHGGPGESLMWCKRMPSWRLASGNHGSCVVAFCLWIQASTGRSWPSPDEESCARLCERATRSCAESFITPTISFNLEPVSSFSLSVISSLLFLHLLVGVGTWGTGILVGVSLLAALVATIIGLLIQGMFSGRPGCSPSRCFVPLLVKRFEIGEVCKCFHCWQAVNGCEGSLWCSSFW